MYEIFNKVNGTYTMPNGLVKTSADLQQDPQYRMLFDKDCVVSLIDGIMVAYETLAQFANRYGIEYSTRSKQNPSQVLEQVLAKKQIEDERISRVSNPTSSLFKAASISALSFSDDQALEVKDLYPVFEVGHAYKKDERFTYNGFLFKVNQDHASQEQWVPGETGTESLYTNLEMGDDGYLIWTQPTGAHDAYNTGDIVNYNGTLYKSLIDGNAYSPDVYPAGWEIYTAA